MFNIFDSNSGNSSANVISTRHANLAAAKANLVTAELKLSYTKIYASVDGEVTNLNISEGAYSRLGSKLWRL